MYKSSSSKKVRFPPMEVLSYGGTSQYTAGGPSACGLASVHAALLMLSLVENTTIIQEALDVIRSQEFIEKIMGVCSLWTQEGHIDVDDVLALPMFATTLDILAIEGNWCGPENFRALYSSLPDDTSTVSIITRPPEIVALFNIQSGDPESRSIQIIFDSHPRPHLHPRGAAFIFFANEEGPINYLSYLFQTDKALMESRTWDASLLGQYTAHVLKLKRTTAFDAERALYQANIRILEEQANLRAATARETALSAEIASLKRQVVHQQQQIDRAMANEMTSRGELKHLRGEGDRLERTASREQMPGSWVGVSRRSKNPPRISTVQDNEPAHLLENGYAKHATLGQSDYSITESSHTHPLQPYNSKPFSNERGTLNSNEEAHIYERVREQNARQEMSRQKGKAKVRGSTTNWSGPPAHQPYVLSPPPFATTNGDAAHAHALQKQLDSELASFELARQLQAQEEAGLQEHRRLVQEATRVKVFDCVICMEKYPEDYSAPIRSCGHVLCRDCMKEHVQSQVDQAVWPIRCPVCIADRNRNRSEEHGVITRDLVETLGIDEAVLIKWVKLEMEKVSVAVECPRCHKTAPVDVLDFREAKELTCPRGCGAHWCKQCNRAFERGGIHSCDGQAELDQLLGQNNWKKCPACGVPVERTSGCNHMTCRCHCHFCYRCGGVLRSYTSQRDMGALSARHCSC